MLPHGLQEGEGARAGQQQRVVVERGEHGGEVERGRERAQRAHDDGHAPGLHEQLLGQRHAQLVQEVPRTTGHGRARGSQQRLRRHVRHRLGVGHAQQQRGDVGGRGWHVAGDVTQHGGEDRLVGGQDAAQVGDEEEAGSHGDGGGELARGEDVVVGGRGAAARGTGVVENGQTGHGVSAAGEERLQQGALLLLSPEGLRVRGGQRAHGMRFHEGEDVIQVEVQDVAALAVYELGNGVLQTLGNALWIALEKDGYISEGLGIDIREKEGQHTTRDTVQLKIGEE